MKTRPLYQILDDLNREIYLPHIQRPFVWGEEQVRKLLDSLLRCDRMYGDTSKMFPSNQFLSSTTEVIRDSAN